MLYNNAFLADGVLVAGTRGWYNESSAAPRPCDYEKISARECGRLKRSLEYARTLANGKDLPIVVFTHFPPVWKEFAFEELISLMTEYDIQKCYYGHIHGNGFNNAIPEFDGIKIKLVSSDCINFVPYLIK